MTLPSATSIMIALLIGVGLILLYLLALNLRNPVLVKIGLRNIPRRPAQSLLIVIGLTLSTIIIVSESLLTVSAPFTATIVAAAMARRNNSWLISRKRAVSVCSRRYAWMSLIPARFSWSAVVICPYCSWTAR
jgi:hypothetical protein